VILGVESSCDESALAVFVPGEGLRLSLVHSQLDLHREYGGVVPDLAAREHLARFPALLERLLSAVDPAAIRTVAVTYGPGLAGCLATGLALAQGWALAREIPILGVNHLRAHAWSPFAEVYAGDPLHWEERSAALLPHLGLLASGGNTLLFRIGEDRTLTLLADTRDDAAGEALDKGAKLLGLPYPGGPQLEELATAGDPAAHRFPRALPEPEVRAFSFSGLKTSLRYRLERQDNPPDERARADLAASYQQAVVDALLTKAAQCLAANPDLRSLGLSGGVANNRALRQRWQALGTDREQPVLLAPPAWTGDNAAMIAFAAAVDPDGTVPGGALSFAPNLALAAGATDNRTTRN
jgi:N6-L-threonylcarbamoyladenine synthase